MTKDHRALLELTDVDIVCIAAPDHWHSRMTLDAAAAGKHVYCERPLARTVTETLATLDSLARYPVTVNVGLQTLADPSWIQAREIIQSGRLGHVAQAQTHFFRNDIRGYGRYYRIVEQMTPQTVDWSRFSGHGIPFDRAKFAHWRCYDAFGSGPFVEMLLPQIARMLVALNVRLPKRVAGLGGLMLEHDGREIPDLATMIVDFDEGCQLTATACTISGYPNEEIIRGRHGALRFTSKGIEFFADDPRASKHPVRLGDRPITPTETINPAKPANETLAMWQHFLDCVRTGSKETLCPPELAATAGIIALMASESLKTSQILAWDNEGRRVLPAHEVKRKAPGRKFADLQPPEYMKLAGPWPV